MQSKGLSRVFQHHSSKASILWCSAFFMVQLSHLYLTTGKTIVLTIWTIVGKVISLLFDTLSRFVIVFLPRSKHLLILHYLYFFLSAMYRNDTTSTGSIMKLTSHILCCSNKCHIGSVKNKCFTGKTYSLLSHLLISYFSS